MRIPFLLEIDLVGSQDPKPSGEKQRHFNTVPTTEALFAN